MTALSNDPTLPARVDAIEAAAWSSLARIRGPAGAFNVETMGGITVSIFPGGGAVNRVYGLGLERPAQPEVLDAITQAYRNHGVTEFRLHLCPTARPPTLPRLLEERGFILESREAVLFRATSDQDSADPFFQIRPAAPAEAATIVSILLASGAAIADWAGVLAGAPGHPGWHIYLAIGEHGPYAVFPVFTQDGCAWFGPVSTLPDYRGRGTESALLAHGLVEARNLGCLWATTYFDVEQRARPRNFARNGFELLYLRSRYVWSATA